MAERCRDSGGSTARMTAEGALSEPATSPTTSAAIVPAMASVDSTATVGAYQAK